MEKINEWIKEEIEVVEKNAKAMDVIFYALGPKEFNRVFTCSTVRKIWDRLKVTHEGTR